MALKISVSPTIEPVSLLEAKRQVRLDSGSITDNTTVTQSISPGSHVIAASYTLEGESASVLGKDAMVIFESGTNGTGGKVDVKLQESDGNSTFTDVTGGAFTQVTEANDNATYELAYTGSKAYLRAVATVAVADCSFGVSIITHEPVSTEDTLITSYIKAAREYCESFQNRSYISQTWELWLDSFPNGNYIRIPLPPLVSVSSVKYYDTSNTEATFSSDDYFVDTKSEPGRLCLAYGESWPSTTLRSYNGVCITFVCGYGSTSSYVPERVRQSILLLVADYYANREAGKASKETIGAVERLLWQERIF